MQSGTIYCSSCGAGNRPQATFCFSCGQKMLIGTPPPQHNLSSSGATGRLSSQYLLKQRYIIARLLGQGGMGAVYQAVDIQFSNRTVAVKEMGQSNLKPQEAAKAAEQFKQEAHLLAGLKHPNLPSIYDHFSENGRWYLVMDFIEGDTLENYVNKMPEQRLPTEEAVDIAIQLSKVLAYLHTRSTPIIFRDLKPANIIITPEKNIYLIDFGIARIFKPGQTKDTVAYVSPGYAAPEQFGTEQTSPQSDIYSLGATLHRLLSGNIPSSNAHLFHFEPLQRYNPTLPPTLTGLVSQMVNIDVSQRPASMTLVKQELESIQTYLKPFIAPTYYVPPPPPSPQYPSPQPPAQNQALQDQAMIGVKPTRPKRRFLRTLPIGVIAGILCLVTVPLLGAVPVLWLLVAVSICIAAGFITGKVTVTRKMGFITGVIAGGIFGLIGTLAIGKILIGIVLILFSAMICGLLSLLGAWLATRKHPYYAKQNKNKKRSGP